MNIEQVFGPPSNLTDLQIERLRAIQEGFLALAKIIDQNTPHVPERENALEMLRNAKALADAAARQPRGILTMGMVAKLFAPIEARSARVLRLWLNAYDYADLRKYGSEQLALEMDVGALRQGIQGMLWGAQIRLSRKIPEGHAVVIGDDEPEADVALVPELGAPWTPAANQLVRF